MLSSAVIASAAVAQGVRVDSAIRTGEQDALPPFSIGLVRADGFLFPLVRFADGVWTTLGVDSEDQLKTFLSPLGRQLGNEQWRAYPISGGAAYPLELRQVAMVDSHCVEVEGFRTNAPVQPQMKNSFPQTKSAIAVTQGGRFAVAERLAQPYDGAARSMRKLISTWTQQLESAQIGKTGVGVGKLTSSQRQRGRVQIMEFARYIGDRQAATYYFEARKRYPGFGESLFVHGWVTVSDYHAEVSRLSARLDDEEKGAETATVLGIIPMMDGWHVWILEMHGYESEAYVLMEFGPEPFGRIVAEIGGGGC